ncbi:hypothetical protein [Streptomyces sp. BE133]|uniref:hypothetical protein n=1 Tax=Streptomyces sp. BE133 TaxID=3002523 RepID=UPI002E78EFD3|nr:hypothetical protein [Streptomyces sp. BE133]MEE1813247.1 hypothetical protein [Streptomyces sp. BE133]
MQQPAVVAARRIQGEQRVPAGQGDQGVVHVTRGPPVRLQLPQEVGYRSRVVQHFQGHDEGAVLQSGQAGEPLRDRHRPLPGAEPPQRHGRAPAQALVVQQPAEERCETRVLGQPHRVHQRFHRAEFLGEPVQLGRRNTQPALHRRAQQLLRAVAVAFATALGQQAQEHRDRWFAEGPQQPGEVASLSQRCPAVAGPDRVGQARRGVLGQCEQRAPDVVRREHRLQARRCRAVRAAHAVRAVHVPRPHPCPAHFTTSSRARRRRTGSR